MGDSDMPVSTDDIDALRARLVWAEDLITKSNILGDSQMVGTVPTRTPFSEVANPTSPIVILSPAAISPIEQLLKRNSIHSVGDDDATAHEHATGETEKDLEPPTKRPRLEDVRVPADVPILAAPQAAPLQPDTDLLVDAYFRNVHRTYPFAHRARVNATLQRKGDSIFAIDLLDSDATITYLILAVGYAALQREEDEEPNPGAIFEVNYKNIFSEYLTRECIDTVQILLLLSIFSQFDPNACTSWPIVDMLCRKAIRLGLTQRDTADEGCLPGEAERRRRLFWSIYVWDRIVATSTGIPVALNDVNMDISLPGITVDEFMSTDRLEHTSVLQVSRHIIQLRILEDKVLNQIHLRDRKEIRNLTELDRRSIVKDIRTEIEDWYSNGCLLKSTGPDEAMVHIRISWLASRYYNLLLLLYYPSHFNPTDSLISKNELVSLAQKHIQATAVRWQQQHLPLNQLTLCRLFPVCMIFLHCFLSHSPKDGHLTAREEISICADIMSAYPKNWTVAHKGAEILRQLNSLVAASSTSSSAPFSVSTRTTLGEADRTWRHAVKISFVELAQQVMGKGSVFSRWDYSGENKGTGDGEMNSLGVAATGLAN